MPLGREPGIDALQPDEAREQERRAHQQHARQRHFGQHEQRPRPAGRAMPRHAAAALREPAAQVVAHQAHGRRHAEEQPGHDREPEREGERAPVHADLVEPRDGPRLERLQRADAPHGEAEPQRAAGEREHHALGEQLADQPPPRGAERRADRHLALPRGDPREHQVGHVGAGDQQHQPDRAHEDEQRGPDLAHDALLQPDQLDAPAAVAARVCPAPAAGRSSLSSSRAPLRSAPGASRPITWRKSLRRPRVVSVVSGAQTSTSSRHRQAPRAHAHDRVRHTAEHDLASHGVGAAAELAPPEAIAQDRDPRGAAPLLVVAEAPPDRDRTRRARGSSSR